MLLEHEGQRPTIHSRAFVAPTAILRGDVRLGAGSVVLDYAVLSAESGPVRVGRDCVVMEHAVLRGVVGNPCTLADGILVGPHAHLSGCSVEDEVFIATRASIFNGARLQRGSEVRIGGVVHVNSRLQAGDVVPIQWVAVGDPARLFAPGQHDDLWPLQKAMRFSDTVWGESGPDAQGRSIRRYAAALRRRLCDNPGLPSESEEIDDL